MVEPIYCVHCGAIAKRPVTKVINGQTLSFCCGGCLQVYEMLAEEGAAAAPAVPSPAVRTSGTTQTVELTIVGMSCENCVARVEAGLRSVPGVVQATVDLASGLAQVELGQGVSLDELKKAVREVGYETRALHNY